MAAVAAGAVAVVVVGEAVAAVVEGRRTLMRTFSFIETKVSAMNLIRLWSLLCRLALALIAVPPLAAAAAPQETFATPEAAVDALMAALKADSDPAIHAIFGEEHKDIIDSSDRSATSCSGLPLRARHRARCSRA